MRKTLRPVKEPSRKDQSPRYDTWTLPTAGVLTLIKPHDLEDWCNRLASRFTELIETHRIVLPVFDGQGHPALTDRWLMLLSANMEELEEFGLDLDTEFQHISDVPPQMIERSRALVQTEISAFLKARGRLDARRTGIFYAKSYPEFALQFIYNSCKRAITAENLSPAPDRLLQAEVDLWQGLITDFEDLIFIPSYEDEDLLH